MNEAPKVPRFLFGSCQHMCHYFKMHYFIGLCAIVGWPYLTTANTNVNNDTGLTKIGSNKPASTVVWHMPRQSRHVALTFDDGPDELVTPQLLDVLKQYNVKATFFLVGNMMAKAPHIVNQIAKDGHAIANHTWAHYRLDEMTKEQVAMQLQSTTDVIQTMGYKMSPYMRPPGGRFNNYVIHSAKDQGMAMVMWDVNAADYKRPDGSLPDPKRIAKRVLRSVRPGSIILMHNGLATVKALPLIIESLNAQSYSIGLLKWQQ